MLGRKEKKNLSLFLDNLIPFSKKYNMPKFSQASNINIFVKKISKDQNLVKKIKIILKKNNFENLINNKKLSSKLADLLDFNILTLYFSSPLVLKRLIKYSRINLKKKNKKIID